MNSYGVQSLELQLGIGIHALLPKNLFFLVCFFRNVAFSDKNKRKMALIQNQWRLNCKTEKNQTHALKVWAVQHHLNTICSLAQAICNLTLCWLTKLTTICALKQNLNCSNHCPFWNLNFTVPIYIFFSSPILLILFLQLSF